MSSGVSRVMTGSVTGTGSAISVRTVGYRPRVVKVYNAGGLAWAVWTEHMADAAALKFITAGTMSEITSDGVTPLSDGFQLGADTDLNVSGEKVYWVAYE